MKVLWLICQATFLVNLAGCCDIVGFRHDGMHGETINSESTQSILTISEVDAFHAFTISGAKGERIDVPNWGSLALTEEEGEFYNDVEKAEFVAWNATCDHCYWFSKPFSSDGQPRPGRTGVMMHLGTRRKRKAILGMSWQSRYPVDIYDGHLDVSYYQPTKMRLYVSHDSDCVESRRFFHEDYSHEQLKYNYFDNLVYELKEGDDAAASFASGYDVRQVRFTQPINGEWNCLLLVVDDAAPDTEGNRFALMRNIRLYYDTDCEENEMIIPQRPPVEESDSDDDDDCQGTNCKDQDLKRPQKWYCVVRKDKGIRLKTTHLREAQNSLIRGKEIIPQAIIPMSGNVAGDPTTLPQKWKNGSMWLNNWPQLNELRAECENTAIPGPKKWYCAADEKDGILIKSYDLEKVQQTLSRRHSTKNAIIPMMDDFAGEPLYRGDVCRMAIEEMKKDCRDSGYPNSVHWYCVLTEEKGVVLKTYDLEMAQKSLLRGSEYHPQAIIPMIDNFAGDPHSLKDNLGRNWWRDWFHIYEMKSKCEDAGMPESKGWYCSVVDSGDKMDIAIKTFDLKKAESAFTIVGPQLTKAIIPMLDNHAMDPHDVANSSDGSFKWKEWLQNPKMRTACEESGMPEPTAWFCSVEDRNNTLNIVAKTLKLEKAQSVLSKGDREHPQAIIPMIDGIAGDPHQLVKDWGEGNMWWWDWNHICKMRKVCEKSGTPEPHYWFCSVIQRGEAMIITAKTSIVEKAQAALSHGADSNPQSVIPMLDNFSGDPHVLDRDWEEGSIWWKDWDHIREMRRACEDSGMPDLESWFCAVKEGKNGKTIVAKTSNLEKAQAALGRGDDDHHQAIIPMLDLSAGDPHQLDKDWGEGSMWWSDWDEIHDMRIFCEKSGIADVDSPVQ